MKPLRSLLILIPLFVMANANATIIGGIEFPDGAVSFADQVVAYLPGTDVGAPYDDPQDALGIPDYSNGTGSVSLGDLGSLTLRFTDNSLTTSGDNSNDLWIFEIGGVVEAFMVEISTNLTDWINLGSVSGQPTGIDIDSKTGVVAGELYSYVRLTDLAGNQTGFPFGEADIDAVGAISSGAAVPAPAPLGIALFGLCLLALSTVKRRN